LGVAVHASPLRVATFSCDVTPDRGEPLIWAKPLESVESPLLAKGVLLEDGKNRYVLCAIDWCLLSDESELSFRKSLAAGANTDLARIAIQSVHQHAAPYADEGAHRLLDAAPKQLTHLSAKFLDTLRARLEKAVERAAKQLTPFDQIGWGQAKVERVASTRRLRAADGKIVVRYSTGGKDPKMAEAPEGLIDPMLKTITFARGSKALVRLHYYATHPQTFCCDGRASADFVGSAREDVEREDKVFQIYFTGCAGDVTVGKYNDTSPEAKAGLAQRLKTAMLTAIAETRFSPATNAIWRTSSLMLPLRKDKQFMISECRGWLDNPAENDGHRVYDGAMRIAFIERIKRPIKVSSLQIGSVHILHLPGEPMLEFQLFAQRMKPDDFVAVAGYGDCGPAYICTDAAIEEGGYEPSAANVGEGSEALLKNAIVTLLGKRSSK